MELAAQADPYQTDYPVIPVAAAPAEIHQQERVESVEMEWPVAAGVVDITMARV